MDNTLVKELKTESQYPWRNPSYSTRSVLGIESCVCLFCFFFFFFVCVAFDYPVPWVCGSRGWFWETVSITQIECGKHTDEGIIAWMPIPSTGSQLHHKKKRKRSVLWGRNLGLRHWLLFDAFFFFRFSPSPLLDGYPKFKRVSDLWWVAFWPTYPSGKSFLLNNFLCITQTKKKQVGFCAVPRGNWVSGLGLRRSWL
jgi:hypothetical protein